MANPRYFGRMDTSFVECQTLGHAWDMAPSGWDAPGKTILDGIRVLFRCMRCPTEKRELWSRGTGEMLYRTYDYPQGYSIDHDALEDALDTYGTRRQAMRAEYTSRINSIRKQMENGGGNIRPLHGGRARTG